jgi:hypothetical protein
MKATNPNGYDRPLSRQDDFLKSSLQAGLISDSVFIDLCDAFYGPKPIIQPLPRIRENGQSLEIRIEYGNTW